MTDSIIDTSKMSEGQRAALELAESSRDTRELLGRSNARAVLAGTYVATDDSVIINARLIDVNSPLILSSCSYNLRMNDKIMKLLTGESPF